MATDSTSPGATAAGCVFCGIVARVLPASIVYEDEGVLAFMSIGQANPGHVLVAPKAHLANVFALDDATAADVFRAAARVARAVQAAFGPPGLSIYQANGAAAGQTVLHLHLHVLPRWDGDGLPVAWPMKSASREQLEDDAARIRAEVA